MAMRLAALYVLVGLVWGVLLGGLTAWAVMAMAAGVSWLYLFGDDPWPEAVGWLIPLIGLVAFLGALAVCVAFGLRIARRTERDEPAEAGRRRVHGIRLLALGLLLAVALAGAGGVRIAGQEAERALLDRQAAAFEALRAERQMLTAVTVARAARDMSYDMTVETAGVRGGPYRLAWSVRSTLYGATLDEGAAQLALAPGDNRARLALDAWRIVERYHEVALGYQDVDVEVAESFRLEIDLVAALRAARWMGRRNTLSQDHHDWPAIDEVVAATEKYAPHR
ncbi:MAG: ABC transporter permease, partial [Proteobacteria bacterium]|nr:ABC transporter permease [Pseudomonadota bacterium]